MPRRSNAAANAAVNATTVLLNGGYLWIYDGTQPATGDTPVTTQRVLARLGFSATAFQPAVAGVATANALTPESAAPNGGTATWFRCYSSSNEPIFDGSVGISDADMMLNNVLISLGAAVSISSFTYQENKDA